MEQQTFERRYNLRVHMRRHTGETPYPCKEPGCSQMFKWRSSLAHRKSELVSCSVRTKESTSSIRAIRPFTNKPNRHSGFSLISQT